MRGGRLALARYLVETVRRVARETPAVRADAAIVNPLVHELARRQYGDARAKAQLDECMREMTVTNHSICHL